MLRAGVASGLLVIAFVLAWPVASEMTAAERCVAARGSFDYSSGQCDFKASHPSPGLWQRHGVTLLGSMALGWLGCALLLRGKT